MIYSNRFTNFPAINVLKNVNLQKDIIDVFKIYFPEAKEDVSVDFEDFFECAIQLYYAHKKGLKIALRSDYIDYETFYTPEDDKLDLLSEGHGIVIGNGSFDFIKKDSLDKVVRPNRLNSKIGFNYPELKCLKDRYFNRKNLVAGFHTNDKGDLDLYVKLNKLYQDGVRHFFSKVIAQNKYMNVSFSLPDNIDVLKDGWKAIPQDLGFSIAHLEGVEKAVHLSEQVEMTNEYRLVVMNGKLITGSGCVEEFTPLDNLSNSLFDDQVENLRNEGKGVIKLSQFKMDELIKYAHTVASEIIDESDIDTFILDVARINGELSVVEVNPFERFGMYALNAEALIDSYIQLECDVLLNQTEEESLNLA